MCLEEVSSSARVATLVALERLFSRMFPHVLLEISSSCARVLALVATVGQNCILQRLVPFLFPIRMKVVESAISKVDG